MNIHLERLVAVTSLVAASFVPLDAAADRAEGKVRTIVLQPGDTARSKLSETVAQNYPKRACRPTPVDGFRDYVPNETRSQYVEHPTTGCARQKVHLLSHGPLR